MRSVTEQIVKGWLVLLAVALYGGLAIFTLFKGVGLQETGFELGAIFFYFISIGLLGITYAIFRVALRVLSSIQ